MGDVGEMNPLFFIDFYKVGHVHQYPTGTTQVWSNWTARSSRVPGQDFVIGNVGLQYFMMKYLVREFNKGFFDRPWGELEREYKDVLFATLGTKDASTEHIERLWCHQHLPIKIYALPEGAHVPIGVPSLVITNTEPEFYWLPNYLETLLSTMLWRASTSATTAWRYRQIFEKYAEQVGETDFSLTST